MYSDTSPYKVSEHPLHVRLVPKCANGRLERFNLARPAKVFGVLVPHVVRHLVVDPELLPLGIEVRLFAVTADEAVQAGGDVGLVQIVA